MQYAKVLDKHAEQYMLWACFSTSLARPLKRGEAMMIVIKLTDQAETNASKTKSIGTIIHASQLSQSGKSGVAAAIILVPKKYKVTEVRKSPIPTGSQK